MKHFNAHGKLLISGEYAVLDGALALAIPTKLGQTLNVSYSKSNSTKPILFWNAYLCDKSLWFSASFEVKSLTILSNSNEKLAQSLKEILKAVILLNPTFLQNSKENIHFETHLEFPKEWGFGSSSTLISLLSQFARIDSFELNNLTFKTSGYDVACAQAETPIFYQLVRNHKKIEPVFFDPVFKDELFFVHLNQKQDTQISVSKNYKNLPPDEKWIEEISILSQKIVESKNILEFEILINKHEELISSKINLPKVKDFYFSDYEGSIKSLGAWGGDFVMVTKRENFKNYLNSKGYKTILSFEEVFLPSF